MAGLIAAGIVRDRVVAAWLITSLVLVGIAVALTALISFDGGRGPDDAEVAL